MKKVNYLNNRDLLFEIHKSKNTFCSFSDNSYSFYDIILNDLSEINDEKIIEAKQNRAKKLGNLEYERRRNLGEKIRQSDCEVDINDINLTDIVFRVMTFDHIPNDPSRKKNPKTIADSKVKLNFPPFQHWKFDESKNLMCVGKSHWKGDLDSGKFSLTHGCATDKLARMWLKLVDRYATRGNVRNYCVDTATEALTNRGWVGIDNITEQDQILSYENGYLKWSKIRSIYKGDYNGLMHKMTLKDFDSLVTPEHKFVTKRGLVKAEFLKESDKLVLLGDPVEDTKEKTYSDEFVELVGWIFTKDCYQKNKNNELVLNADRIKDFTEDKKNIFQTLTSKSNCKQDLNMNLILDLTADQREILIKTIINGDLRKQNKHQKLCETNKNRVDMFQALCAIAGTRTTSEFVDNGLCSNNYTSYYNINLLSKKKNTVQVKCINFYGGKNNGRKYRRRSRGKENHPNNPTTLYKGKVWCPETEYGCFVARRNGSVFLTGNTYNDEMKGQAILQLSQIGLQFDESKSNNPFAYYTAAVTNSFIRVINIEKRNQNIRDDILEQNGLNPSYTRTYQNDHEAALKRNNDEFFSNNKKISGFEDDDYS